MTRIAPTVLADWGAWTRQFEGDVSWMYLDVRGLVTVGLGCLIDPVSAALALQWLVDNGAAATTGEIAAEWDRVKAMPAGLDFHAYRGPLHLSDAAIDALAAQRVQADADILVHTFTDFEALPDVVQKVLLSMAWAMGAGWPAKFPICAAAVRAHDWAACADNCAIDPTGNPGVVPRNAANRALFLEAAGLKDEGPGSLRALAPSADVPDRGSGSRASQPLPACPDETGKPRSVSPDDAPAAPDAQEGNVVCQGCGGPLGHGGTCPDAQEGDPAIVTAPCDDFDAAETLRDGQAPAVTGDAT